MKKFLIKICCFLFAITMIALSLSLSLENAIFETISTGFTKNDVTKRLVNGFTEGFSDLDLTTINRIRNAILESNEINDISSIFINTLIEDVKNNKISRIDISVQLNSILNNNLSKVPKVYHEEIINRVNNIDYNKIYVNIIEYVNSANRGEIRSIAHIYNLFISFEFRFLASICFISSIIFIILLNKPKKESLHSFGVTLSVCGGIMILLLFMLRQIGTYLVSKAFGLSINMDFMLFTCISFGSLVIGIVMIDIYERKMEKDDQNRNAKKLHLRLRKKK